MYAEGSSDRRERLRGRGVTRDYVCFPVLNGMEFSIFVVTASGPKK